MSFGSDKLDELQEEPKDRTKWLWLGVIVLIVGGLTAMWFSKSAERDKTEVRAKHILVSFNKADAADRARALERITELRDRIKKGESFGKLAQEFSNDEFSSSRGGDLGYYEKGQFEGSFEDYVWRAPIGELSDIVQTSHGFHLIIVVDRHVSKAAQHESELEKKARESGAVESKPLGK